MLPRRIYNAPVTRQSLDDRRAIATRGEARPHRGLDRRDAAGGHGARQRGLPLHCRSRRRVSRLGGGHSQPRTGSRDERWRPFVGKPGLAIVHRRHPVDTTLVSRHDCGGARARRFTGAISQQAARLVRRARSALLIRPRSSRRHRPRHGPRAATGARGRRTPRRLPCAGRSPAKHAGGWLGAAPTGVVAVASLDRARPISVSRPVLVEIREVRRRTGFGGQCRRRRIGYSHRPSDGEAPRRTATAHGLKNADGRSVSDRRRRRSDERRWVTIGRCS